MDIFKLTPQVSEDTLEYCLYPRESVHSPAALRTLILEYVAELLPSNFLWHRDTFEINVKHLDGSSFKNSTENSGSNDWMFDGRMRVGDCVDDEWCAVWLLKEISTKWDLVVSVRDSDGEFLLIEAADVLPAWITPENAENRVWIYKGHLHIVPLQHESNPSTRPARPAKDEADEDFAQDSLEAYLSVKDALSLVSDDKVSTRTAEDVEKAAFGRVIKCPAALAQHVHRAKVYVPVDVARALATNPALIQRATEAFYTRDALQLRAAQRMSRFPPKPDVLTSVSMTRPAYAQLVGQVFHPPKVFGVWQEKEGTPERRWKDVGMKIACGFEMMYAESKAQVRTLNDSTSESREARMDALRRDPDYSAYIQGLVKAGYFGEELSGSQKYKEREQVAADKYVEHRSNTDATRPSFAAQVEASIQASPGPASGEIEEDSTDWLNVDESTFDSMLEQRFNRKPTTAQSDQDAEEKMAQDQAARLQELAKKVEGFVEGKGDLEGARFEDDILDDEDLGPDSDDESIEQDETELRQQAMDQLVAPLEPGDYGQMPASYSKSQPVSRPTMETETRIAEDTDMPALGDSEPTTTSGGVQPSAAEAYKTSTSTPHESGEQSSQKNRERPLRRPLLPRDRFDGVDSDDEDTDPEDLETAIKNGLPNDDSESEEDRPTVVGEIEIDMDEEQEEFIKFSREALGIDDALWNKIMEERSHRGASVPKSKAQDVGSIPDAAPKAPKEASTTGNEIHWFDSTPKQQTPRTPASGPRPNGNPKLDSFEAVMEAMEAELQASRTQSKSKAKAKVQPSALKPATSVKGKEKEVRREEADKKMRRVRIAEEADDDEMDDIEAAMERELRAALGENGLEDSDEEGGDGGEVSMDYNLIKNFLESFKGQAGMSGPVSNLAGRLQQGWMLPRDNEA